MPTPDSSRSYAEDPFEVDAHRHRSVARATPAISDADVTSGLDRLEGQARPKRRRVDLTSVLAPLGALALVALGWQCLVWLQVKPTWALPPLGDIAAALWRSLTSGDALSAIWVSLRRGVIAFLVAVVLGSALGLLVGRHRLARKAFRPLLAAIQSLPSVAWVPFAVMMFYLTDTTIYAVILLSAVPSIAMGLIGGLDQVPPLLERAGRTLGASRTQLVRHVLLPAAMPTYLAGIKQGWAFAWRSLMAAELIVSSPELGFGLGSMLSQGQANSDMPTVIAAIALVLAVGLAVELLLFNPIERSLLRRRGLTAGAL
ncbi:MULTISPECIES: ABC transporter permease [Dermacoccus]|uniref:ABC transporter permease n=2 Tax=Dermacoccus TaxID=57495 RepID=A0A417Z908_9MICO|nr:ABC transporter permease [Dermacoccus abyssi]RHW47123.1 ABC transporter permease [Dermacoccus abyssi]